MIYRIFCNIECMIECILFSANIQNDDRAVIGTYRGNTYYSYLKNMQGSTESIISETGTTAAVYTYSDFGETEEVVADTIGNEICYTGAIYDKDTGLYYMNARYYDAENGRFISQDSYRGEIVMQGHGICMRIVVIIR